MNSRQRRKATRHMELERAVLLTGMCRMATKANEAAQALGKLGAAMKAARRPNFIFCTGSADPFPADSADRRFWVVAPNA